MKTIMAFNNKRDWAGTRATKVFASHVDKYTKVNHLQGAALVKRLQQQSGRRNAYHLGSSGGDMQMGALMAQLKYPLRKLLLFLAGRTGAVLVSAAALWGAALGTGYSGTVTYEMLAAITLIRLIYNMVYRPNAMLGSRSIRKRVGQVVEDEVRIGIVFVVVLYVMQWPVGRETIALFLAVNLMLRLGMLFFSQLVLSILPAQKKAPLSRHGKQQVVIVGTGPQARSIVDSILDSPDLKASIRGFLDYHMDNLWRYRDIPLIGHPDLLKLIIATEQIDAVIMAVEAEDMLQTRELFDTCEKMGLTAWFAPDIYQPRLAKVHLSHLNGTPALVYRTVPEARWSLLVKGIVDKVGAAVGLVLITPLMLLAAAAIKIDSKGPVLFKQKRCGLNGKQFPLYKFRTMCRDAEKKKAEVKALNVMSGPVFKAMRDPRVTRVGQHLRKWSIDEVPQFFNVLRGDMSLVGPRPPLPSEVAQYEPWQRRRLSVKPGVTCLWQVNGRNNVDFEQWVRLDLQYIDNWSPWLDTKILAKTLPAVIKGTGAS